MRRLLSADSFWRLHAMRRLLSAHSSWHLHAMHRLLSASKLLVSYLPSASDRAAIMRRKKRTQKTHPATLHNQSHYP